MADDRFKVSRLTEDGIQAFRRLINHSREGVLTGRESIDRERRRILKSKANVRSLRNGALVNGLMAIPTRRDAADHAIKVASDCDIAVDPNDVDIGFWSWLSLVHLWPLHRSAGKAKFQLRPVQMLVPEPGSRRFYKHLLGGPAWILDRFGDDAAMLLDHPAHEHGDIHEQLLGNRVTSTSRAAIAAAQRLFRNENPTPKNPTKTGANPNTINKPGLRLFVKRIQQYACTHDVRSMSEAEILDLFPDLVAHFEATGA